MPNLMPCPMPTCGAPIDSVHLVPQGMGAFTYVVRCDCGLSFDTGAQSEAAAADRWNDRPEAAGVVDIPEYLVAAIDAEQERLCGHDYLMTSQDCIDVIRESMARLNGAPK